MHISLGKLQKANFHRSSSIAFKKTYASALSWEVELDASYILPECLVGYKFYGIHTWYGIAR